MKIIVIGAHGTIGSAVVRSLEPRHEVVRAARRGPVRVDLADPSAIDRLFTAVPGVGAVVCCAASGGMTPLLSGADEEFTAGLDGKLLGQVHLVRRAVHHVRDGGSITLTSGRFAAPVPGSSWGHLVNAGLEAFVRAAAIEMPRGIRLNVVSPGWVAGTPSAPDDAIPVAEVARAYLELIEGSAHGEIVNPKLTNGESST
ncbi:short chain dehydrogenase [Amycolatopsis granulosa]|uniref:short chain dehydrogenase n=1 Tax=Amycolatopsis granulosa TaxID=185684 RepID=UPI00141F90D1|nr:NAD(P)-dependent dehydrogenase (short-subunit alcohol dehydrogenase family) [Amycolatopsis granulosa]